MLEYTQILQERMPGRRADRALTSGTAAWVVNMCVTVTIFPGFKFEYFLHEFKYTVNGSLRKDYVPKLW